MIQPSTPKPSIKNFNHKFESMMIDRMENLIYRIIVPHKHKDRTTQPNKTT
jgi:hypothetical protein